MEARTKMGVATWASIGWLLVSGVPHGALHGSNGENLNGLLGIEYGFHVTLMAAGLVVAKSFFDTLPRAGPAEARAAPARPPAAAVLRKVAR